jgi:Ca-activated chloride channel family protein
MRFHDYGTNPAVETETETTSTFALDVDTASYTLVRNYLNRGILPPPEAVRVEEFVNYFRYEDAPPAHGTFAIRLEVAPSPFDSKRHLLRIAIVAKEISKRDRKDLVLTFVIDVSGSMDMENRLGLVKKSLRHLVKQLRPTDRVGIVIYGSQARKLLDPTPIHEKGTILATIDDLRPEGSTNAEAGLRMGFETADRAFDSTATNRIVLCSDGVANVGATGPDEILKAIADHAARGIALSTLGFGMGNYNDVLMEQLANKGNGNYAYIDDFEEAKNIFGEKLVGMMETVAADAKVQVQFDAAAVAKYRLLGYENRRLKNEDFRNDKVDAGEVGAGHRVTALYEIALQDDAKGRLAKVSVRYREPDTKEQVEPEESISVAEIAAKPSASFRLAACVAQFAELLRKSPHAPAATVTQVLEVATPAVTDLDKLADGAEFLELLKKAAPLLR